MNIETCYKDLLGHEPLIDIDHDKLYRLEYKDDHVDLVKLVRIETNNTPVFHSILTNETFKQENFYSIVKEKRFKETDYNLKEVE